MKKRHFMVVLSKCEVERFTKKGYSRVKAIELAMHKHDYYISQCEFYYTEFKNTYHVFVMC